MDKKLEFVRRLGFEVYGHLARMANLSLKFLKTQVAPFLLNLYRILVPLARQGLATRKRRAVGGAIALVALAAIFWGPRGGGSQFVGRWESVESLFGSDITCEIRHNSGRRYFVKMGAPAAEKAILGLSNQYGDMAGGFMSPAEMGRGLVQMSQAEQMAVYDDGMLKVGDRPLATFDAQTGHLVVEGIKFQKAK